MEACEASDGRADRAVSAALSAASTARAEDPDRILKAMYDYIGNQKNISMAYDSSVEVVTPSSLKVQFASSGQVLLSRPD